MPLDPLLELLDTVEVGAARTLLTDVAVGEEPEILEVEAVGEVGDRQPARAETTSKARGRAAQVSVFLMMIPSS